MMKCNKNLGGDIEKVETKQGQVEKLAKKGMGSAEIASTLGISIENVNSRLLSAYDRGKIKKLPGDWNR